MGPSSEGEPKSKENVITRRDFIAYMSYSFHVFMLKTYLLDVNTYYEQYEMFSYVQNKIYPNLMVLSDFLL